MEYVARYIAGVQQRYTQRGGVRPFGLSTLICGFDKGTPQLFQTDPSGTFSAWKANAIGRQAKTVREFLEKNYDEEQNAKKLAIRSLMEVVESGAKNIEITLVQASGVSIMTEEELSALVKEVEEEKEAAEAAASGSAKP